MRAQPLSIEQTQLLCDILEIESDSDLREQLEEFILDYGYDESDHDDIAYEVETVTYEHRSCHQGSIL